MNNNLFSWFQCCKANVKTLYLGRFILELSLMEYKFVFRRDSLMAAAALYIARITRDEGPWVSFSLDYRVNEKLTVNFVVLLVKNVKYRMIWTTIKLVLAPKSSTNLCWISYGLLRNSPTVQHFQHFLGDL